jgi:hypothetical protein
MHQSSTQLASCSCCSCLRPGDGGLLNGQASALVCGGGEQCSEQSYRLRFRAHSGVDGREGYVDIGFGYGVEGDPEPNSTLQYLRGSADYDGDKVKVAKYSALTRSQVICASSYRPWASTHAASYSHVTLDDLHHSPEVGLQRSAHGLMLLHDDFHISNRKVGVEQ